ncbi:hypothetical protein FRC06_002093 [Ceratobasidium sp. 370]|nr:hypothetical protein FRC06_002093 [Ceratobasidium sp. 370]
MRGKKISEDLRWAVVRLFICERITNNPDTFLDELREELSEVCGVNVSLGAVWRTLHDSGRLVVARLAKAGLARDWIRSLAVEDKGLGEDEDEEARLQVQKCCQ